MFQVLPEDFIKIPSKNLSQNLSGILQKMLEKIENYLGLPVKNIDIYILLWAFLQIFCKILLSNWTGLNWENVLSDFSEKFFTDLHFSQKILKVFFFLFYFSKTKLMMLSTFLQNFLSHSSSNNISLFLWNLSVKILKFLPWLLDSLWEICKNKNSIAKYRF